MNTNEEFNSKYNPKEHGRVLENGLWLRNASIFEFITTGLLIGLIFIIESTGNLGHTETIFTAIFTAPFLLLALVTLYRYIRHVRRLRPALENGTVILGEVTFRKKSFGATWLSLGGFLFGGVFLIEYAYKDSNNTIQKGKGFVRDFRPDINQPLFLIYNNVTGFTAIINGAIEVPA